MLTVQRVWCFINNTEVLHSKVLLKDNMLSVRYALLKNRKDLLEDTANMLRGPRKQTQVESIAHPRRGNWEINFYRYSSILVFCLVPEIF